MNNYKLLQGYSYKEINYGNYTMTFNIGLNGENSLYVMVKRGGSARFREFTTNKPISDIMLISEIALVDYIDRNMSTTEVFERVLKVIEIYVLL